MSGTITENSLFERIGGMKAVNAAVDIFYQKVIQDNRINHFFDKVDMVQQPAKMKAFLAYAFGGSSNYSGKDLRAAHAHMHLNEDHFNTVAEHLVNTLHELDVPQGMANEVMSIVAATKQEVLNK